MNTSFLIELTVLILAAFLGVQVISKVPTLLHTPLMSGTNAIHGIVIVGAIIVAGAHGQPTWLRIVSLAAVALATGNVVGGFVVTDRMLEMFKPKKKAPAEDAGERMSRTDWIYLAYLVTIVCFIVALQFLSHPARARHGNWIGAVGMAFAIVATFFTPGLTNYASILVVMAVSAPVGAYAARAVKMTAIPEMVALFNGVGGGAAALVALADFHNSIPEPGKLDYDASVAIVLSALIGSVSFAGSLIAFAKLRELIGGRPIVYPGQQIGNLALLAALVALGFVIVFGPQKTFLLVLVILGALAFGVLFVLPIGGADMPVVISLLNAFTGVAAAATGFVLHQNVLIVSGMLVGASGTLLTLMMARAMGRSVSNVFFGAFGQLQTTAGAAASRPPTAGRCARPPPRTWP